MQHVDHFLIVNNVTYKLCVQSVLCCKTEVIFVSFRPWNCPRSLNWRRQFRLTFSLNCRYKPQKRSSLRVLCKLLSLVKSPWTLVVSDHIFFSTVLWIHPRSYFWVLFLSLFRNLVTVFPLIELLFVFSCVCQNIYQEPAWTFLNWLTDFFGVAKSFFPNFCTTRFFLASLRCFIVTNKRQIANFNRTFLSFNADIFSIVILILWQKSYSCYHYWIHSFNQFWKKNRLNMWKVLSCLH